MIPVAADLQVLPGLGYQGLLVGSGSLCRLRPRLVQVQYGSGWGEPTGNSDYQQGCQWGEFDSDSGLSQAGP
jgi:hypothetical protein